MASIVADPGDLMLRSFTPLPVSPILQQMSRSDHLLAELQRLSSLSEMRGSPDAHLQQLTSIAARLLNAQSCTFMRLDTEQLSSDVPTGLTPKEAAKVRIAAEPSTSMHEIALTDASELWTASSGTVLCSPIKSTGRVIGVLHVRGPVDKPCFDLDDLWLLKIVTVYIGMSLHTLQLQNLL